MITLTAQPYICYGELKFMALLCPAKKINLGYIYMYVRFQWVNLLAAKPSKGQPSHCLLAQANLMSANVVQHEHDHNTHDNAVDNLYVLIGLTVWLCTVLVGFSDWWLPGSACQ